MAERTPEGKAHFERITQTALLEPFPEHMSEEEVREICALRFPDYTFEGLDTEVVHMPEKGVTVSYKVALLIKKSDPDA